MMDLLEAGAAALGLPLNREQLARFASYYALLIAWNERVNLTAITDESLVQTRHFVDSLAVGAAFLAARGPHAAPQGASAAQASALWEGRGLIDLGTGAGFPGLPLKILWPDMPLTLVDSVGKKTAFLQALAGELGFPDVVVITSRAEALGQDRAHRGVYDVATARAVAALPVLAEYGLPLCRVGGWMFASKKGNLEEELAAAERAVPRLGGGSPLLYRYTLPAETEPRLVVGLPKIAPTPSGYPRRVGLPTSRPLGSAP